MAFGSTPADSNNIPIGSVYVPGTGFKAIQGGNLFTDGSSNDSAPMRIEQVPGSRATYTYSNSALAVYATPKDIVTIRGSSTKLVKIVHIEMSMLQTTAGQNLFYFQKHTVANTGGTSTSPTPMKHDSSDAAASATVLYYTVVPTVDATAVSVRSIRILGAPAAATTPVDRYTEDFGDFWEPVLLRGVAQEFSINFNTVTWPTGGVLDYTVTWTEE